MERFAVYFAPPAGSALAEFGASWLGWDAQAGKAVPQPGVAGLDPEDLEKFTQSPRRYGFHGTLKAPFRLAEGTSFDDLREAVSSLAADLTVVNLGYFKLKRLGRFLALVPSERSSALETLAGRCVMDLDRFRAPAPPEETARRRKATLTPRQEDLLQQWGYPYVLDQFRFHLTLTGALDEPDLDRMEDHLSVVLTPVIGEPVVLSDLYIFGDPGDGQSCRVVQRIPVGGA